MPERIDIPFFAHRGHEPYIFVSYAHNDSDKVFPILKKWSEHGIKIWYDEGIDPGNEWPLEIERALKKSAMFIVFITPSSVGSRNVRNEINYALASNLPFLAVYLEETELLDGLGLQMGSTQAIMKYRMEDNSFYYKSETVINQTLGVDNNTYVISGEPRNAQAREQTTHRGRAKRLALYGGCAAALLAIFAICAVLCQRGGYTSLYNQDMGVSLWYPKSWEVIDDTPLVMTVYDEKTETEICVIEITNDIVDNMADYGNDLVTAAELVMDEWAEYIAYYDVIHQYNRYIDINNRMAVEGEGSFFINPLTMDAIVESSTQVFFRVRQSENRIFVYALSVKPFRTDKEWDRFVGIYEEMIKRIVIEKSIKTIEERVAAIQSK